MRRSITVVLLLAVASTACAGIANQPRLDATPQPPVYLIRSIKGWENATIDSLCFDTDWPQFYHFTTGSPTEQTTDLFRRMGYKVLPADAECDAVFSSQFKIQPSGEQYMGAFCYNSSVNEGWIRLEAEGQEALSIRSMRTSKHPKLYSVVRAARVGTLISRITIGKTS